MKASMDPHQPSALAHFVSEFGALIVGGGMAFVAWVMKTFTSQHLTSMKELTAEVRQITTQVASMDAYIKLMNQRQDDLAGRVGKLEDHGRGPHP